MSGFSFVMAVVQSKNTWMLGRVVCMVQEGVVRHNPQKDEKAKFQDAAKGKEFGSTLANKGFSHFFGRWKALVPAIMFVLYGGSYLRLLRAEYRAANDIVLLKPSANNSQWTVAFLRELFTRNNEWNKWEMAAMSLATAGHFFRLWAKRTMGAHFTIELAVRNDHTLVTDGPYACVRHPGYSGLLLQSTGDALFEISTGVTLGPFCLLSNSLRAIATYLLPLRANSEDEVMRKEFGRVHEKYCDRVRWKLIPFCF